MYRRNMSGKLKEVVLFLNILFTFTHMSYFKSAYIKNLQTETDLKGQENLNLLKILVLDR